MSAPECPPVKSSTYSSLVVLTDLEALMACIGVLQQRPADERARIIESLRIFYGQKGGV